MFYFRELEHVNILKLLGQCTETLPFLVIMEFPALVCEPWHEKNNNLGSRPDATQTGLHSHRSRLEARKFGFKKKRNCTICLAKTKALISFAVIAKLVCAFVFAYADCWFFDAVIHVTL